MPLAASMVASVAMKGRIRRRVTIRPLRMPTTAPAATPPSRPGKRPYGLSRAETTLAMAAVEPTERSMPPVMMTKHMPSAISANIEL